MTETKTISYPRIMLKAFASGAALAALAYSLSLSGVLAAEQPAAPPAEGLTISDCLGIMAGLNALDAGYRVIVAAGKPTESAETIHFKFPGRLRDAIGHDEFMLGQVQQEVNAANRRTQLEIIGTKEDVIKPGSKDNLIFDQRMSEYTAKACTVQLDHIRDADLDLEHNEIPGSVLSLLTKIRDK